MRIVHTANLVYEGDDRLDVSPQGKDPTGAIFAPSWSLRSAALDWRLATGDEPSFRKEFETRYLKEVETQIEQNPKLWADLLNRSELTLVCSCARPDRCHRVLLAKLLARHGLHYAGERTSPYGHVPVVEEPPTEVSRIRRNAAPFVRPKMAKGGGEDPR